MIFIDHREKKSPVPDQLEKLGVPIKFVQLKVGDYVITGEENILCIERKAKDYVPSLVSGHLNNQLYSMSHSYGFSIIIVEGSISSNLFNTNTNRGAYISSLVGSIVKRAPDGKSGTISMIPVETPYDTALALKYLHDKNNSEEGLVRLPKLNPIHFSNEDATVCMLATIPGIGLSLAKSVLNEFHTIQNVSNVTPEDLMRIPKIGKKKAMKIFEFFRYYFRSS